MSSVCPLLNLFPQAIVEISQGRVQFLGLFLATEQKASFWNGRDFGTILVPFFGPGTAPSDDFLPLARLPCSASLARKNVFCGWVQMKQVLAVRLGAKKAVGHIVSKKWWPTVGLFGCVVLGGGLLCFLFAFVLLLDPSLENFGSIPDLKHRLQRLPLSWW